MIIVSWLSDLLYEIKYRTNPRHKYHKIDTKLKPGYHEFDTRLLHGAFSMFEDFMTIQLSDDCIVVWNDPSMSDMWMEMNNLYNWWTIDRPPKHRHLANLLEMAKLPPEWDELAIFDSKYDKEPEMIKYRRSLSYYNQLNELYYEEDTSKLIQLCSIRRFIWD